MILVCKDDSRCSGGLLESTQQIKSGLDDERGNDARSEAATILIATQNRIPSDPGATISLSYCYGRQVQMFLGEIDNQGSQ